MQAGHLVQDTTECPNITLVLVLFSFALREGNGRGYVGVGVMVAKGCRSGVGVVYKTRGE